MHRLSLPLLAFIGCGLITQTAAGQVATVEPHDLPRPDDAHLQFDHLTIEDGLSQQTIAAIIQDRHGFMWFGTGDGLNRYDGYTFKKYLYDPRDPGSLRNGFIRAILEDEDGMLWISYDRAGLSRFDPATEVFTHFQIDVSDHPSQVDPVGPILQDRDGILWVGTLSGLCRFDPDSGTCTRFQPVPDPPEDNTNPVIDILEDRSGRLWVGTRNGLYRFDRTTGAFDRYLLAPEEQTQQGSNWVTDIYEDRQGTLWVGAWGLHQFDPETGTFDHFLIDAGATDASIAPAYRVVEILEDDTGVLWVGASGGPSVDFGGGLNRFDRDSGTFMRYLHDPSDPHSLNENNVWSIYQDRQGVLWVGTVKGGGLNRVDRTSSAFTTYPVGSSNPNSLQGGVPGGIYLDRDDVLWVGTLSGVLNRFDRRHGTYTYYRHDPLDPNSLLDGEIWTIYRDRQGTLWVGSRMGLNRFDPGSGTFTHYRHDPNDPASIASNEVRVIYEDRSGMLWIGVEDGGLNRFDRALGTFTSYVHDPGDSTSLSGDVRVIYEDLAGSIWIGTWNAGLNRFDRETGTFTRYLYDEDDPQTLNNNSIFGIYERPKEPGILWVSSWGGLDRLDVETGHFTHYTTRNSELPSNTVTCVLGDDDGYLWMSTHAGLVRFDPDREQFKVFKTEEGLQMLEFELRMCHKGYNSELFFGGTAGINAIRPGNFAENPNPPEVALTGLRLFNEPVVPGPDTPLQTSITETGALRLAHDQNDLTLEYAGLHFRHPERNEYAYMLEGYEDAWREVGTERRASYTNLPPGQYTFRVKASNSDGVWNEEGRALAITILPPWWRTLWAFTVYGLLFAVGVFSVDRWRQKRLVARERLRAEREKAKAIETTNNELQRALKHLTETQDQLIHTEKMASLGQLTAGIAHEIKNPLNFVNNFAQIASVQAEEIETILEKEKERLTTESAHELRAVLDDLKINAGKINEHGQRADGIIRSMLEHSRADRGERRPIDLNKLVDEYANLAFHSWQAAHRSDTIHHVDPILARDYDKTIADVELYPQEIGRVLINLLDNAFYAVNERRLSVNGQYAPRVSVSTKRVGDQVEVHVSDNGAGIPKGVRDRVFEPFFTTKPAGSGTGLGLSLSYDIIVKGHGGSLTVESEEGEGATFVVALPSGDRLPA